MKKFLKKIFFQNLFTLFKMFHQEPTPLSLNKTLYIFQFPLWTLEDGLIPRNIYRVMLNKHLIFYFCETYLVCYILNFKKFLKFFKIFFTLFKMFHQEPTPFSLNKINTIESRKLGLMWTEGWPCLWKCRVIGNGVKK